MEQICSLWEQREYIILLWSRSLLEGANALWTELSPLKAYQFHFKVKMKPAVLI